MTTIRRLAAILAADVAGYSRLMAADEVGTLDALKACRREVVDLAIAEHRGRIVKTTGDGMLVEFASAVDAVTCAMSVQESMAGRGGDIAFRIGINVGDIIIDGDDIFGDGVNVAARVESECEPGGVSLSANAFEQVRNKTSFVFEDLGEKMLKNIERPVRIYAVHVAGSPQTPIAASFLDASMPLPLPDKPSIAVLPFQNMSGDPEQEYFADGMVEDITTALSRFKSLFVIARNSSFTYKGKAIDIKKVGRELGVRYVLEGSVRKAGSRVRITGQLIEAATVAHLWADKFEGTLEDIFALQDRVTSSVVGIVAPRLEQAEIERALRKPTSNLEAYDYYLRGVSAHDQWSRTGSDDALRNFRKAIELDPHFAAAMARKCSVHTQRQQQRWMDNVEAETAEAVQLAQRTLETGREDASALAWGAFALTSFTGQLEIGISLIEKALKLNPNLAPAWMISGFFQIFSGQADVAIGHCLKARQLNPIDPLGFSYSLGLSAAHFYTDQNSEALVWIERALADNPRHVPVLRLAAAIYANAGKIEKARQIAARLLELSPTEAISRVGMIALLRRPRDVQKLAAALRLAGIPE